MKLRTKFSGPTDTRGARIIVSGGGHRYSVEYDYSAHDKHLAAVQHIKAKHDIGGTIQERGSVGASRVWEIGAYQPRTGARCGCRPGVMRDNCSACEGTGHVIDFRAIRAAGGAA